TGFLRRRARKRPRSNDEVLSIPCKEDGHVQALAIWSAALLKSLRHSMNPEFLDLEALSAGVKPGLSERAGAAIAEAAAVCLEEQGHIPGCLLRLDGVVPRQFPLLFRSITAQERASWNDHEEATEQGAYAVAISIMTQLEGYSVLERSRKGTGFD